MIEDGAFFKGSIDISKPEAKPLVTARPPVGAPAPTPSAPAAAVASGSEAKR